MDGRRQGAADTSSGILKLEFSSIKYDFFEVNVNPAFPSKNLFMKFKIDRNKILNASADGSFLHDIPLLVWS